ncbi:PhyR family response regulator anti-anti-sigma factor [Roseomonas rosulenta]|uniref:PhyR family response regulator anti-anti-sigma factor n=1 Tax=Roseomonas rosulenta TaxID=2748667 RepID=UPI0018DF6EB3
MTDDSNSDLLRALPYARRYARALTGSQTDGDRLVAEVLRAGLPEMAPRLALYAAITRAAPAPHDASLLTPRQRQLLLLTALEDLRLNDAALVVGLGAEEAGFEIEVARTALRAATVTDVVVIEDEPVIAMDIRRLVEACGHRVVGVAATEAAAVALSEQHHPGLIVADINLGRGGDGISAVARIARTMPVPVIFVTAYPERLLTAERPEPTFLITKPFDPMALAVTTYQAITAGRPPIV